MQCTEEKKKKSITLHAALFTKGYVIQDLKVNKEMLNYSKL